LSEWRDLIDIAFVAFFTVGAVDATAFVEPLPLLERLKWRGSEISPMRYRKQMRFVVGRLAESRVPEPHFYSATLYSLILDRPTYAIFQVESPLCTPRISVVEQSPNDRRTFQLARPFLGQ
jgi:hypothetical protein